MAKRGQPTKYSSKLTAEICAELRQGKSLRQICQLSGMPADSTVYLWLSKYEEFSEQYARAREAQAEYYANEIIDIADELPICTVPDPDGGTSERVDAAGVQRNKLRVDARKWVASKLLPKKYGDKIQQEISGKDGMEPVRIVIQQLPQRDPESIKPEFDA